MHEPSPRELALGYIYQQELDAGDLRGIEIVEQMIADERFGSASPLYQFVLHNVGNRMTGDQWQQAIGDVVANILTPPPLPAPIESED